jgi:hypothetical protein
MSVTSLSNRGTFIASLLPHLSLDDLVLVMDAAGKELTRAERTQELRGIAARVQGSRVMDAPARDGSVAGRGRLRLVK